MWLQEFRKLFPEATERYTRQRQNLEAVEHALATARSHMRVGPSELRIIETTAAWSYPDWWPRLSETLDTVVELPKDLRSHETKRRAVEPLQDCLKHIEVVSVVLRFLRPSEFGILSPPVVSLLNLAPADNHVDYYMRYLDVLEDLARHYRIERVADVDMALWSAAHLSIDPAWASLKEEMEQDKYFQEVRLRNLVEGLGRSGRDSDQQRLLFARVLVRNDHMTAALIAARSYESAVLQLAQRWGVSPDPGPGPAQLKSLVKKLDRQPEILRSLELSQGDLRRLLDWRHDAVHPERHISKRDAEKFVQEVGRLWENLFEGRRL